MTESSKEERSASNRQNDLAQEQRAHEVSEEAVEREERLLKARREAAEAESRAEIARAKAIRAERKAKSSENRSVIVTKVLSSKLLTPAIIVIVAVAVAAVLFGTGAFGNSEGPTAISSSSLERLVNISKLSTAEFVYNGIAEQTDDNGNVRYHVYYKSTVRAGVDMSEIEFDVDEENKTVTPLLPDIVIDQPILDETSLELMPRNPNADLMELIALCKNDAMTEVQKDGQIYDTAQENLRSTVEALIGPVLEHSGYTLVWESTDEEDAGNETQGDSDDNPEQIESSQEGGSDE